MIDVGHRCNISCTHCYHAHEKDAKFKPVQELKAEIDQAKSRGNNYIDFSGGEPTIYPDIAELIKYCESIDMKCCVITNGLAGAKATESILNAGVDDWLVSVHGTSETCDKIMQLPGARDKQERFLKQLQESGSTFRFNCCMLRENQDDLIATAKWAAQWKPRIFNWINFNPHHGWQEDIEGTKRVIAGLDVLEAQLSQAIPILLDAGIGVNVRYYPMCRLPEAFRMHVCNDYHVLFDPYEWDYGNSPKTFQNYYASAVNMSNGNEWKGQPCQTCSIKYICGGPNSAFYRASGMKGCVSAIKDDTIPRDDFYYYRHLNTECLTPRVPLENTMCIAAIADERYRMYVPLFLYCATKSYPEYDIKIFTTYHDHEEVKKLVDRSVGYGVYDSCIVKSENVAARYSSTPAVSAAMRFVEFEDELSYYDNVLWTDIDMMLFPDGDLIKKHRDQMKEDGTEYYESFMPLSQEQRVCAVIFLVKEWWGKTKQARGDASKWLSNSTSTDATIDEEMLFRIITQSGLTLPPRAFRKHRHHGNHFGDWRLWKSKDIAPHLISDECRKNISNLIHDAKFMALHRQCGSVNTEISDLVSSLEAYIKCNEVENKAPQANRKIETVTPKCKKPAFEHHEGSFIIFTVVDEAYQWYIPMFARSLEIAYPGQRSLVAIRGGLNISVKRAMLTFKNACITEELDVVLPSGGWATAALRFLYSEGKVLKEFDFCLITDIDIMLMPEHVSIIDQHMRCLKNEGLGCYENLVSERRGSDVRLPGVHFVTKDWWEATKEQRAIEYDKLAVAGATEYCYDEYMLGRIVKNSGLKLPSNPLRLQWQHGVHIGDWRISIDRKVKVFQSVWQKMHIAALLKDECFMAQLNFAADKIEWLKKLEKEWRRLLD
jgi:MoaA/NifB/PqqE/SkfB family radical SAM enzyme